MSNPNPGLEPDDNTITNHRLQPKYTLLKTRLEKAGTPWHVVEQQTWEIQEYLGGHTDPLLYRPDVVPTRWCTAPDPDH